MVKESMLIEETIDVMDVNKLKQSIIDQVQRIDDVETLKIYLTVIEDITAQPTDVYKFSEKELKEIDEAEAEFARGEFFTNEEVNREIDEWFAKG